MCFKHNSKSKLIPEISTGFKPDFRVWCFNIQFGEDQIRGSRNTPMDRQTKVARWPSG